MTRVEFGEHNVTEPAAIKYDRELTDCGGVHLWAEKVGTSLDAWLMATGRSWQPRLRLLRCTDGARTK
jgi:hypothetical protein